MFTTTGRLFTGLTRASMRRGFLLHGCDVGRLNSVRPLALSSARSAGSKKTTDDEEVKNEPLKFSTSKASHRTWKVNRSMGSQHQRVWWKVLPLSLVITGFLLWCVLRNETDFDGKLGKQLYEHLPNLLSDEEEQEKKK